ncbi:MAG TPA: M23 family metallopeptidase [Kofleriaceae bacterium]|nr:M23 family metallopeptidase [Kofleriaceae bacterium]
MRRLVVVVFFALATASSAADASPQPIAQLIEVVRGWVEHLPLPGPDVRVLTTSPISPEACAESSGYGYRDDPFRHDRRFHAGRDYRADPGTPVLAAGDGVVVFAGRQGGYGNVVYVDHGGGVVTRYAHLRKIETKRDRTVAAGDRIGQVGSTGRATGPHLHFEVRIEGRAVDPVLALQVASVERGSPALARVASLALVAPPPAPAAPVAGKDRAHAKVSRPERPGRAPRPQVLW